MQHDAAPLQPHRTTGLQPLFTFSASERIIIFPTPVRALPNDPNMINSVPLLSKPRALQKELPQPSTPDETQHEPLQQTALLLTFTAFETYLRPCHTKGNSPVTSIATSIAFRHSTLP